MTLKRPRFSPLRWFQSRGIYHEQAEKLRDLEKILKFNDTIFLLMKAPRKELHALIGTLSARLSAPVIAPYASFYTENPYEPILKIGKKGLPPDLSDLKLNNSVKVAFDIDRMDQYFVSLGSGVYAMDDADIQRNHELKELEFDVKLMTIPDADNRMLLCFIDPAKLPVTFRNGDRFNIRFDGNVPGIAFPNCEADFEEEDDGYNPDEDDIAWNEYLTLLSRDLKSQEELDKPDKPESPISQRIVNPVMMNNPSPRIPLRSPFPPLMPTCLSTIWTSMPKRHGDKLELRRQTQSGLPRKLKSLTKRINPVRSPNRLEHLLTSRSSSLRRLTKARPSETEDPQISVWETSMNGRDRSLATSPVTLKATLPH